MRPPFLRYYIDELRGRWPELATVALEAAAVIAVLAVIAGVYRVFFERAA